DHHIRSSQAQFLEKTLGPLACHANEDAAEHIFILGRILTDDENPCGAIQPPPMKDRPPLDAKIRLWIDVRTRILHTQRAKWFCRITGVKFVCHDDNSVNQADGQRARMHSHTFSAE